MSRRFRATIYVLSIGSLILVSAAWTISTFRLDAVAYRYGWLIPLEPQCIDQPQWSYSTRSIRLAQCRGSLFVSREVFVSSAEAPEELAHWEQIRGWTSDSAEVADVLPPTRPLTYWRGWSDFALLGLGTHPAGRQSADIQVATIPHWIIAAMLSVPLGASLFTPLRRSLRRRRGLCIACAYDLRATPAGNPCPECGQSTGLTQQNNK